MEDLVLVGYGGHAKSVADSIERQGKYRIVGYTDLNQHISQYAYLGTDDKLEEIYAEGVHNAVVTIGYLGKENIREVLYKKLKSIGYNLPIIIDPSAIVSKTSIIEEGTFIGKNVIVNSYAKVGKMAIINTKALIEHECMIGDFSHVAVNSTLCGAVNVGERCLIGAGAVILQTINIGDCSVVGAGTIVTKSIEASNTVKNIINIDKRINK